MASKMVRVTFIRAKAYGGRDYAIGETAEVEENWARRFLQSGSARLAEGATGPDELGPLKTADLAQHPDPSPTRQRGGAGRK